MINILAIIFFLVQFLISYQTDSKYSYRTFNDKFTYIKYTKFNEKDSIQFYLGNELLLLFVPINQNSTTNITMENNNNNIIVNHEGKTILNYNISNTKVYYLKDKCFLFVNETCETKFNFTEYLIIDDTKKFEEVKNATILSATAEYIFIENYLFTYIAFIFGCLITSYGAYHYFWGFFIHIFYIIFFLLGDANIANPKYERYILYVFFFSFLVSATFSLIFYFKKDKKKDEKQDDKKDENQDEKKVKNQDGNKVENQDENQEEFLIKLREINLKKESDNKLTVILNSIYGIIFGTLLFKTIIYHSMHFGIGLNTNNYDFNRSIYLSLLFLFSGVFCFIYIFDIFKKYRYLICSTIAGSYYIIKSIEYIIGGYISNYLLYLAQEKYEYNNDYEIALTYFLIHIFIIIYSVIFQLFYLKHKESSMPSIEETGRASNFGSSSRTSRVTNDNEQNDQPNIKDEDESLLGNKNQDENSINEEGDINDQDD
jgi:hypothetical protein